MDDRQRRFVAEYLVDLNATQAAIRAGYSKRTASSAGWRLLRNVEIQKAISAGRQEQLHATGITAEEVLKELKNIALVDIGEAYDDAGNLKPLAQIPARVRRAIVGLESSRISKGSRRGGSPGASGDDEDYGAGDEEETLRKVRFADKLKALELLGRHLRLYVDVVEHDVTTSAADLLLASRKRVDGNDDSHS